MPFGWNVPDDGHGAEDYECDEEPSREEKEKGEAEEQGLASALANRDHHFYTGGVGGGMDCQMMINIPFIDKA